MSSWLSFHLVRALSLELFSSPSPSVASPITAVPPQVRGPMRQPSRSIHQAHDFGGDRGGERSAAEAEKCVRDPWHYSLSLSRRERRVDFHAASLLAVGGSLAQSRRWPADGVRLLVCQHVPKNGRDSSHHRHASNLRTATQLDSSIPLLASSDLALRSAGPAVPR